MKAYNRWVLRQAGRAQCSPALGVLALLLTVGIVCYIYREVILTTLIVAVCAAVAVAVFMAAVAVSVSTLRWYRKQKREAAAAISEPDTWTAPDSAEAPADAEAMKADADWLASGVELAFGPDGTLKAKDPK